ncbi:MAG: glutathione S-transferase family protein [Myxococcota bacterium]
MSTIQIFGFSPSTFTQTAVAVAKETAGTVELAPLEFKQASHLERHPYGKMPALQEGDVRLYETAAIIHYLDEAHGDKRLTPATAPERARMWQWISVGIDYAYPTLVGALHDDEPGSEAVAAAAEQLKLLDVGLDRGPYFAGKKISLADFVLYPMVAFAVDKLGSPQLGGLARLRPWFEAMAKRRSFGEAA